MALCFDPLALTLVPSRGPIQSHMAQLHQSCPLAQLQHLQEHPRQRRQMVLAKVGDSAEVGRVVGRQHPEGDVLVQPLGYAPRGGYPDAVAVEQHLHHHPGMVGQSAQAFLLIAVADLREIKLPHHVGNKAGQMVLRQPLLESRRQQQLLLRVVATEGLVHRRIPFLEVSPRFLRS